MNKLTITRHIDHIEISVSSISDAPVILEDLKSACEENDMELVKYLTGLWYILDHEKAKVYFTGHYIGSCILQDLNEHGALHAKETELAYSDF